MWTALHAALGAPGGQLTFDLVQRACAEQIPESASLDWKRDWPLTGETTEQKQAKQQEFAKDIAAMANSGGGLIVYGVDETRIDDRSVADHVASLGEISEARLRPLYQAAANLIYPAVVGLSLVPVANLETAETVLVAMVPDGVSRPHLIHPKGSTDWFAAPWRSGSNTMWMSERQLADEYRQRERGHAQRDQDLDAVWLSVTKACGAAHDQHWVIGVLQPERAQLRRRPVQRSQVDAILSWCDLHAIDSWDIGGSAAISAIRLSTDQELRRGLRMFYRATRKGANAKGRVEVHADGTVVLAVHRTKGGFQGHMASMTGDVAICDIEQLGLDLAVALLGTRAALGVTGDYTLRVGVEPGTQIFRRSDPTLMGHFTPWEETDRAANFRTVTGTIGADTLEMAAEGIFELIRDVVHQTGQELSFDVATAISRLEDFPAATSSASSPDL